MGYQSNETRFPKTGQGDQFAKIDGCSFAALQTFQMLVSPTCAKDWWKFSLLPVLPSLLTSRQRFKPWTVKPG